MKTALIAIICITVLVVLVLFSYFECTPHWRASGTEFIKIELPKLGRNHFQQYKSLDLASEILSNSTLQYDVKDEGSGYPPPNVSQIKWNDPRLDLLRMPQPVFKTDLQNPCWYEPLDSLTPYMNNTYITYSPSAKRVLNWLTEYWKELFDQYDERPRRLRCFPYFLIIGQPKSGSTDLFWKIAKHPDISAPPIKELHWWSRNRQGRRFLYSKLIPIDDYLDMFDRAALSIEERIANMSVCADSQVPEVSSSLCPSSQIITGEASVSLFWDNDDWMNFHENQGQNEPLYIVPHYIHHFIPDVKLILMLRDPVERMYSDYLYFHSTNKSADDFHGAVTYAIDMHNNCTRTRSIRQCAYDPELANKLRVRLRLGMYSVYLTDWLDIFSLKQFFILRLEEYSQRPVYHIKQIYRFLEIREISPEEETLLMTSTVSNPRKPEDKVLGGMNEDTRALLSDFYKPYNIALVKLLHDPKYMWEDSG